ncbi:MAG: hypothetical protein ACE5MI_14835 [Acidimicrobiia bacterium]
MIRTISALAAVALASSVALAAQPSRHAPVPDSLISEIKAWANDPVVIQAIKEQNAKHASLSQDDIDRLDKQWRAETRTFTRRPLIDSVLGRPLSAYLKTVKARAGGLYNEIFVMDNKGLNVGQSDVTSDYWQGDEAKWQKTFLAGSDAIFVDEVDFDESTQTYQSQVNISIADPSSNTVIGAVTVGVNVDEIQE